MNDCKVQVGQEWAVLHGGIHDLFRVTEVLEGRYLRPPDVALIPCEFCRIVYLTGRLEGRTFDQRAPSYRLDSAHKLYRRADGTLTEFGAREEERKSLREELSALKRRQQQIQTQLRGSVFA